MTDRLFKSKHHHWGLPINSYPKLYSQLAIAARGQTFSVFAEHYNWRSVAIATISDICKLEQLAHQTHYVETAAARITLQMLECVLELTRFPDEFENFALPSLVAGSIVLMSSVQPTPFFYEYGYLSFRILIFSLNTCIIKHGQNLEFTVQRMMNAAPGTHLSFFWQGAMDLLAVQLGSIPRLEKRLTNIINPSPQQLLILERSKLNMLLNLLDNSRKHFLAALITADSLQLSGLMFILWKYLENERENMNKNVYNQKLLLPYSRIFRRYQMVFPENNNETELTRLIFVELTNTSDLQVLQEKPLTDIEDSRTAIHAYNRCLNTFQFLVINDGVQHMNLLRLLFIPGCEDLLPSIMDSTFRMLWKTWPYSDMHTTIVAMRVCSGYICRFFQEHVKALGTEPEPWRYDLVDTMIITDTLELALRIMFTFSQSQDPSTARVTVDEVKITYDIMIALWQTIAAHTPEEYFGRRLRESGVLDRWNGYLLDLRERVYMEPSTRAIILPFSKSFAKEVAALSGVKWNDQPLGTQNSGTCNYLRCPHPTKASLGCSKCMNAVYCSARCLAK
ncbi:unnamed protein product [Rhizoctonia solani]|nr:unnamed protein product [Rhizoctonia solani]